jgi:hypothetical protein
VAKEVGISFGKLFSMKLSDIYPSLFEESKIHKNYFIDPIKNRHNQVEKLVFERLVKVCK